MKISVVIPSYNRGDLIAATLDAILAQTRAPDEVIVVDDGSTDNTAAFVRDRYAGRVRLIEQPNGGPESARKHGFEAATGDWIANCDSDDLWRADHLARLEALHARVPDAGCLFTNFTEVGRAAHYEDKFKAMPAAFWGGHVADADGFMDLGADMFPQLIRCNPFFPSCMMVSRAAYMSVGGIDAGYARLPAGDADLTRRLALKTSFACDWHVSVEIAKHGGNFSADDIRVGLGKITMLKDYLAAPEVFGAHAAAIRTAIEEEAAILMQGAFSGRDMAGFRKAAAELPFGRRPMGLKLRSLIAALPAFLRGPIFRLHDHNDG